MRTLQLDRGDTIIELVLAFTIFSLAAVTTIVILNKGIAISQRSLEKSLVRQQIDSQAETIRYIQQTHDPIWQAIVGDPTIPSSTGKRVTASSGPIPLSDYGDCPTAAQLSSSGANGFFVAPRAGGTGFDVYDANTSNYDTAQTYAQISYGATPIKAYGLWVQVVKAENNTSDATIKPLVDAYDFYIHGCWQGVGQDAPMTVGTIVRVYAR